MIVYLKEEANFHNEVIHILFLTDTQFRKQNVRIRSKNL